MNALKINFRSIGVVSIFGVWIIALLFNLYRGISDKNVSGDLEIDYVLENATRVEFNSETGHPARLFQIKTLEHHPKLQQNEFTSPLLIIYKPNLTWRIEAKKGTAEDAQNKQIVLKEEVVIQKQEPTAPAARLTTDFLTYLPDEETLETESPVTILQGKQRVEAVGMKAFLKTKQVDLLSHVRGYYVPES